MNIPLIHNYPTVILANGDFPKGKYALKALRSAKNIICCDGALVGLVEAGLQPAAVVGDMDSLPQQFQKEYANFILRNPNQDINDLTKAVNHCITKDLTTITLLGATGKREDHTFGNISLLASYAQMIGIQCITDYGVFAAVCQSAKFESFAGQQVSVFSLNPSGKITSEGLKYPLRERQLTSWWQGALNEAIENSFSLHFSDTNLLVYRTLPD